MFLLPFGHLQIKTKLSKEIAEQKLAENLEPRRFLYGMFRGEHKFFEGSINKGIFEMNRVVGSKNSFNPILSGAFEAKPDYTVIDINVSFHFLSLATIGIAFVVILFFSLCLPLQFVRLSDISLYSLPQFLANSLKVPAIIYLIVIVLFNVEVSKDLNYLEDLFASKR